MRDSSSGESFNYGVKDGVRGFFTDPSKADDSFVPFIFNKGLIIKKVRFGNSNGTIRPECWMEIDCSNVNTISYTPIGNIGTTYARNFRIYSDWSDSRKTIYSPSVAIGRQEVDISKYDSVILVLTDWDSTSSFLVSDIKVS